MPPTDFSFLLKDLDTQRTIGRDALRKAEELDQLLKGGTITDPNARQALEDSRKQFLLIASELASNANATTGSANTVFELIKRST